MTAAPACDPDTLTPPCRGCCRRMHRGHRPRKCADGHPGYNGHGLCSGCASTRRYAAHRGPRRSWRRDDLLHEWAALRGACTWRTFPERVGVTREAWERAFYRARAAGDQRAVRGAS